MCRDKDGSILTDEREAIERWKQHFDEHLNGAESTGNEGQDNGGNAFVSTAEHGNQPAPTLKEVKDAIHQLKNNKAAGKDGIRAELIEMGPEMLAICLHRLIGYGPSLAEWLESAATKQSHAEGVWVRFPVGPGSFRNGNFLDFPGHRV